MHPSTILLSALAAHGITSEHIAAAAGEPDVIAVARALGFSSHPESLNAFAAEVLAQREGIDVAALAAKPVDADDDKALAAIMSTQAFEETCRMLGITGDAKRVEMARKMLGQQRAAEARATAAKRPSATMLASIMSDPTFESACRALCIVDEPGRREFAEQIAADHSAVATLSAAHPAPLPSTAPPGLETLHALAARAPRQPTPPSPPALHKFARAWAWAAR